MKTDVDMVHESQKTKNDAGVAIATGSSQPLPPGRYVRSGFMTRKGMLIQS
ncbi:hypothetical protein [Novosphingobium sp.]|uniref:hypothetical protein n=1 Tax=Novosphingobium sp. TaxID=1874826 RepID=UPI0031D6821E